MVSHGTSSVTQKRRRKGGKNKKKNWRRGTDIKDVEDHLEEKRHEERTGGLRSEKPNEELVKLHKEKDSTLLNKQPAKRSVKRVLNCFRHLEPSPWSEPITKPAIRRKTKNPIKKAKLKLVGLQATSRPSQLVKYSIIDGYLPLNNLNYDIWDQKPKVHENAYQAEAEKYFKEGTCKQEIKVPGARFVKPSPLPAVEVPAAGASYNPAFDDHQKLLQEAHDVEIQKKMAAIRLHKSLTQKFPTRAEAPTELTWLQEMSHGLNQKKKEADDEESEVDDTLPLSCNPPTLTNRKTRSKRNKELRQKKMQETLQKAKLKRKRMNEIFRVKSILSDIVKAEKLTKVRQIKRLQLKQKKLLRTARLGPHKYETPDKEIALSTELSGTLREMKPQGSVLEDRLKSLQRRNMIEPRVRQTQKRKYKLKKYVKKSHKE